MIIPKHRICDICRENIGVNNRYHIIKSKEFVHASGGDMVDNRRHDVCERCMRELVRLINESTSS